MRVTLEEIKDLIEYNTAVPDISVRGKGEEIPIWRGMFCMIASEVTSYSQKQIGKAVNRSGPTVVYWKKNFKNIFLTRPDVELIYHRVLDQLKLVEKPKLFALEMDRRAEEILNRMAS